VSRTPDTIVVRGGDTTEFVDEIGELGSGPTPATIISARLRPGSFKPGLSRYGANDVPAKAGTQHMTK